MGVGRGAASLGPERGINDLALDPVLPMTLYAATEGGWLLALSEAIKAPDSTNRGREIWRSPRHS